MPNAARNWRRRCARPLSGPELARADPARTALSVAGARVLLGADRAPDPRGLPGGAEAFWPLKPATARALCWRPEAPYPLAGGGALRTASLLQYLARTLRVDLIVFREPGAPDPAA